MKKLCCAFLLAFAACAPVHNGAAVRQAEADNVWRCKPLSQVSGQAPSHGENSPGALDQARADAMNQAAASGADTVVWLDMSSAHALTYQCF